MSGNDEEADSEPDSGNETNLGVDENVAGVLCYVLTFISGAFFYLTEEDNDFVRFHAMQSILFGVTALVVYWVFNSLLFMVVPFSMWGIIGLLMTLLWLLILGVWVLLMYKAYEHERYKLPVLGDIAENKI